MIVFHSINKHLSVKHAIRNWRYKEEKDPGLSLSVATRAERLKKGGEKIALQFALKIKHTPLLPQSHFVCLFLCHCSTKLPLLKEKFCL